MRKLPYVHLLRKIQLTYHKNKFLFLYCKNVDEFLHFCYHSETSNELSPNYQIHLIKTIGQVSDLIHSIVPFRHISHHNPIYLIITTLKLSIFMIFRFGSRIKILSSLFFINPFPIFNR